MKTCICGRTKIMWNTHRVGVTADNIVRYRASSLTVLQHSLAVACIPRSSRNFQDLPRGNLPSCFKIKLIGFISQLSSSFNLVTGNNIVLYLNANKTTCNCLGNQNMQSGV